MKEIQGGVLPAMATPLGKKGVKVQAESLKPLVDFLIDAGVKGLFVGGTTGEGILLNVEQRMKLHELTLEAIDGRVPALVHVGTNSSAESHALASHAQKIGAKAIVAVTPYFYPLHDRALLSHFQSLAAVVPDTPFFAYDIPQMAVNTVSLDLLADLGRSIPSFAGLKSSVPDAQKVRLLVDAAGDDMIVLAGNERIALGSLAMGVNGLISGLSTAVPEPFVGLASAFSAGDIEEARRQQKKINRILDLIPTGARIGAIKTILAERGIAVGPAVAPRPMPEEGWTAWDQIQRILGS